MRYTFRCIHPGDGSAIDDALSLDLPGLEAVRMAALRLAIDLRDRKGPVHWRGWTIEATDQAGCTVLTVTISPEYPDLALAS